MGENLADGRLRYDGGQVARLTLAAPERRNAISRAMWAALPPLCAAIAADDAVRVVVLQAEGEVFSAGADIGEFAEVYATPEATAAYNALVRAGQAALAALPRPVIAQVAGACVGGGCGLALSCDLIFAAPGARFGITPARLGLAYSWEDTAALVARVGPGRARDMLFSGRLLPAIEALAVGLIDRVEEDVAGAVAAYAADLAALSATSIRTAKQVINALVTPGQPGEAAARAVITAAFAGADFAEGKRAFQEKRKPRF